MRPLATILLSFPLAAFSLAAFPQNAHQGTAAKAKPRPAASPDAQFANKAAEGNLAEVALGQLATQKAQSDDVKRFAQKMVDDHQKAEQDLEGIASKNNLTLPKTVSAQQKAEQQRLQKLSGAAFDRAYMQMMVKDHTHDVAEFKKEANSTAANSDLRDYAKRTYPTVDDHLTNAKSINDTLSKSAASSRRNPEKKSSSTTTGAPGLLIV